ncbi:hypothetical protein Y1Q_0019965 [Alligator mississippiensis]|uniref:Uncharacterized protein n=1 Tax=Alligator mississippiensis TaxID=8496 RepID=A0A151PDS6_ALLMI|nr:hypothetical protein Y1Q_0019965 [Alligator mississippiensis]
MSAAERLETGESTGPKDSFSKNISCLNDHVEEAANVSTLSIRMDDADKTPLVACSCETILPQHKAHEELQRTEALDSATQGAAQKGFFAETTEAGGKAQINQLGGSYSGKAELKEADLMTKEEKGFASAKTERRFTISPSAVCNIRDPCLLQCCLSSVFLGPQ